MRFHRVEPEQLPVLAASGDVVVTIADTDSSPSSLLEAMASGRPIVGGWCPSIDEWIRPGEGAEMVECRDVDAVAAALIKLLADPDLRRAYGDRNAAAVAERVAESAARPGADLRRADRREDAAAQPTVRCTRDGRYLECRSPCHRPDAS